VHQVGAFTKLYKHARSTKHKNASWHLHVSRSVRFLEGSYTSGAQIPCAKYKFCTVAPNTCGPAIPNLLHVTHLTHRILMWLLEFWKISAPVRYMENEVGGVLGLTA
jgi:hypothetical protein